jgi:hypothetical protein
MGVLGHRAAFIGLHVASVCVMPAANSQDATSEAVVQSAPPPISQKASVPPLHLSGSERTQIRQALQSENTEVSFELKSATPALNFTAAVGATIPKVLKLHPLPRPLICQMPRLKHYSYLKFKHNV